MKKTIAILIILGILIFPKLTIAARFNVDRTGDTATPCVEGAGDCSLRGAIIAANQNPGLDTINIPAGEYILKIEGRWEDATATGDLDIIDDVDIEGAGETQTIINANGIDRVIHILANATVEIDNLTVTGGFDYMSGENPFGGTCGGIYNGGTSYLKMRNCRVAGNRIVEGVVGGIYNEKNSTLMLSNCTITENEGDVTAIKNEGLAEITNSSITKNLMKWTWTDITVTNSGTLIIKNSDISKNCDRAYSYYESAGLSNSGELTMIGCTVSDHNCEYNAGIFNSGNAVIDKSIISNNWSDEWFGGIRNWGTLLLTNSNLKNNGGIWPIWQSIMNHSDMTMINCTSSDQGMFYSPGSLKIKNSTIIFGWDNGPPDFFGNIQLKNTIVIFGQWAEFSSITSLGHNLFSDETCNPIESDIIADPLLGPLTDNGGPTETYALLPGSPAIDAGDNESCLETDQRGIARPQDGDGDGEAICDIGAYELDILQPTCQARLINPGYGELTVSDDGGLAGINIVNDRNAEVVIPPFTHGTTDPVVVTATKIDTEDSWSVSIEAVDVDGNSITCDPVITLQVREKGKPVSVTITEDDGLMPQDIYVSVRNGDPGIKNLEIIVNGEKFKVTGLGDNEVTTIDILSAMMEENNSITLTAKGKPNTSATVVIHDGTFQF